MRRYVGSELRIQLLSIPSCVVLSALLAKHDVPGGVLPLAFLSCVNLRLSDPFEFEQVREIFAHGCFAHSRCLVSVARKYKEPRARFRELVQRFNKSLRVDISDIVIASPVENEIERLHLGQCQDIGQHPIDANISLACIGLGNAELLDVDLSS